MSKVQNDWKMQCVIVRLELLDQHLFFQNSGVYRSAHDKNSP